MAQSKLLIIMSAIKNEAITHVLSNCKTIKSHTIFLQDFLEKYSVFDQISEQETKIQWCNNDITLENNENSIVLSRLIHIPKSLFNDFTGEDKNYALAEFNAYLGFALNQFKVLNKKLDENGREIINPLPTQWEIIKASGLPFSTPRYYWGDSRFCHLTKKHLIYSDIYNFSQWKQPRQIPQEPLFCFKKPQGDPYFALVINDAILIYNPKQHQRNQFPDELLQGLILLAKKFNYLISEILFFWHQDEIQIGFINPFLLNTQRHENFAEFVEKNMSEMMQ